MEICEPKINNLVPKLELCQKIPKNDALFWRTTFVWDDVQGPFVTKKWKVKIRVNRSNSITKTVPICIHSDIPAPTIQELNGFVPLPRNFKWLLKNKKNIANQMLKSYLKSKEII